MVSAFQTEDAEQGWWKFEEMEQGRCWIDENDATQCANGWLPLFFFWEDPFLPIFCTFLRSNTSSPPAILFKILRIFFEVLVGSWVIFQDFPELWLLGISMIEILLIKSTTSVMGSDATLFVGCGCGWFLRFLTPQMFNALCRLGYDPCF